MILDVGCGDIPKGDVNVDLFLEPIHRDSSHIMEPRNIPNFVVADTHHLPFRNNTFETVYSSHLLEHCLHPLDVLKEFERVSKSTVLLKIPSALHYRDRQQVHIYSWTPNAFRHFCELVFKTVDIYATNRKMRAIKHIIHSRFLKKFSIFHKLFFRILENYRHTVYSPEITAVCFKTARRRNIEGSGRVIALIQKR